MLDKGRPALAQPEPDVAGELTDQELLRCANIATPCYDLKGWERELRMMRAAITADRARRPASTPAGERQAAPVPVASNVYFEFVVSDADYCTQAGGIAPSYAQAVSEGQRYLAQYQQDGPHTLEVRRVEALPLPSGEVAA